MSFPESLTLALQHFVRTRLRNDGADRVATEGTLAEPIEMKISHSTSGKGEAIVDRHLVQFTRTVVDAVGVPRVAIVNFTIAMPRSTVSGLDAGLLTNALWEFIRDAGGNETADAVDTDKLAQLMRGES